MSPQTKKNYGRHTQQIDRTGTQPQLAGDQCAYAPTLPRECPVRSSSGTLTASQSGGTSLSSKPFVGPFRQGAQFGLEGNPLFLVPGKSPRIIANIPPVWRNGRRDRLKICFTQVSGGSSPSTGTLSIFPSAIADIRRVD